MIRPFFNEKLNRTVMLAVTLISFGIQFYALRYLPVADCLPFKKGNSIPEKMKIPAGARPDSFAIRFIYEKDGKEFEFSPSELPADLGTYKFVKRKDKLIRKGNAEPPIKGFALIGADNSDSTQAVLDLPYAMLLFAENFDHPVSKWEKDFSQLYLSANTKNIPVFLVTAQPSGAPAAVKGTEFAEIPILKCDHTAIRTAARVNPTVYLIQNGVVKQKWSFTNFKKANSFIQKIPVQNAIPIDPGIGGDTTLQME
jgi:hypothetical protein